MPAWAAAILRLTPLWIWIAISLTILSFGAGGLVQRSLEGARLYKAGVPVTATVSMEDIAGKAVPFGHRRTIIWIWYEYQGTRKAMLYCGNFDDCPHLGDTMTVWVDPADPDHFVTDYGDLEDNDFGYWFLTVVGAAIGAPLAFVFWEWASRRRIPRPRRRIALRAAARAIERQVTEPPADPPSRRRHFKRHRKRRR